MLLRLIRFLDDHLTSGGITEEMNERMNARSLCDDGSEFFFEEVDDARPGDRLDDSYLHVHADLLDGDDDL